MTVSVTEREVVQMIEAIAWTGSLVAMLIVGLLVYLLVRPPRRGRGRRGREPEAGRPDSEELLAALDRMERRLEVLERAVAIEARDEHVLEAGAEGPETRRRK